MLDGAIKNHAWAKLEALALYECEINPARVAAAVARWPALTELAIRSDAKLGAAMLAGIFPAAPRLVELALINGQLSEAVIEDLLVARPWPKLKKLYLAGNKLSAAGIKALKQKLPKVKIDAED